MLLGIPEIVANATKRVPVLFDAAMATYSFHRNNQLDWKAAAKLAPSELVGATYLLLVLILGCHYTAFMRI